jgi:hypothetical protein
MIPQLNEAVITISVIEEHDGVRYVTSRVFRMDLAMSRESDIYDFIHHIHQSEYVQHVDRLTASRRRKGE